MLMMKTLFIQTFNFFRWTAVYTLFGFILNFAFFLVTIIPVGVVCGVDVGVASRNPLGAVIALVFNAHLILYSLLFLVVVPCIYFICGLIHYIIHAVTKKHRYTAQPAIDEKIVHMVENDMTINRKELAMQIIENIIEPMSAFSQSILKWPLYFGLKIKKRDFKSKDSEIIVKKIHKRVKNLFTPRLWKGLLFPLLLNIIICVGTLLVFFIVGIVFKLAARNM